LLQTLGDQENDGLHCKRGLRAMGKNLYPDAQEENIVGKKNQAEEGNSVTGGERIVIGKGEGYGV